MSKDSQNTVMDMTGVELTPGEPTACLGNGEQGFECCCDECDYYLLCFPEFDPQNKEKRSSVDQGYISQPYNASANEKNGT